MYKKIPGNRLYRINENNSIIDYNGNIINENKSKIKLTLYGNVRLYNVDWLKLISMYEIGIIPDTKNILKCIKFVNIDTKMLRIKSNKIMVFKKPIYYTDGFRIIPNYPRYAININGIVLDTLSNSIVEHTTPYDDEYPCVYIYNPDRNRNMHTKLHRLLGFAWIPNNDYFNKPIINHIDGNKSNYSLDNLEWVSFKYNSQHAADLGLVSNSLSIKVLDTVSGDISTYPTISNFANKLGIPNLSGTSLFNNLPGYLYKRRYEVKLANDDSDWYYENIDPSIINTGKSIYTFKVYNSKDGNTNIFNNLKAILKYYKLKIKISNIEDTVLRITTTYPYLKISFNRNAISGPYRIVDITNDDITVVNTIIDVGKKIDLSRTELQYDLSRNNKFIYNKKYIVLSSRDTTYSLDEYINKPTRNKSVIVLDTTTNSEQVFKSLRETSRTLGVDRNSIVNNINTGKIHRGYIYRTVQ